jgi:hypothetical protein
MSYRGHVECIQKNVLFGSAIAGISFGHDKFQDILIEQRNVVVSFCYPPNIIQ